MSTEFDNIIFINVLEGDYQKIWFRCICSYATILLDLPIWNHNFTIGDPDGEAVTESNCKVTIIPKRLSIDVLWQNSRGELTLARHYCISMSSSLFQSSL